MIEANIGDLLEDAWPRGKQVYATRVIDPCMPPPLTHGRNSRGVRCPICKEIVVIHIIECQYHNTKCSVFYCADCWLAFDNECIGRLTTSGDFVEMEDENGQ